MMELDRAIRIVKNEIKQHRIYEKEYKEEEILIFSNLESLIADALETVLKEFEKNGTELL